MNLAADKNCFRGGLPKSGDEKFDGLAAKLEFFSSALSGAEVGTWQLDMDTGLVTWDATTSTMFGLEPVPVTTEALLPVHPDDQQKLWKSLEHSHRTGEPHNMCFRALRPGGFTRCLHGIGGRFPADAENARYVVGIVLDVTERKENEEARLEVERQLASVIDNLPGIAYRCELEAPWRMRFVSDAVASLTGYSREDFLSGRICWADVIVGDSEDLSQTVSRSVADHSKFDLRYRIRCRSGEERWVQERGEAIYSDTGQPLFLEGFIGDIHDQTVSEKKLRETEERLRRAAQATQDTIWDWDLETDEVTWDAAVAQALGFEPRDLGATGDWWLSRVHPDDRERVSREVDNLITGSVDRLLVEYRFQKADGVYADILDRGYLIKDEDGQPIRIVGAMMDNTERNASLRRLQDREARLGNVFEQAIVGIMEVGENGSVQMVNSRFCEILGRSAEELKSCTFADYTHPDDLEWNRALLREKRDAGEAFQIEKRYLRPDSETVWCNVSVSFVKSEGEVTKTIVLAEDITSKKAAEAALHESDLLHRSVLEASADCIKIIKLDGTVQFMNTPGLRCMEIESLDDVRGRQWPELWPEASRQMIEAALDAAAAGESVRCSGFCPTAKGTPKWWDISVTPMRNEEGEVERILAISRDSTVQRRTAEELQWASEHDALTSLPNRRAFEARLQAATIRAMESGGSVGLLLLDLDHFKHVNDSLGHAAGDHLLKVLSRRLKESVRATDFVARLGGDEFAVIVEDRGADLNLPRVGASILNRLKPPIRFDERLISAGASFGGALFPANAQNANELLKNADAALYALKASGRGGTIMFHQHMREQAQLVASQLGLARMAISQETVEPHYQQKVELATGRVCGFEALLRWRHSTRGIQCPDTVSEAFKDYELATKIGDLMQRRVFADLKGWLAKKLPVGFVAVNAAPAEFLRDDFAERFLSKIAEFQIPPALIEVEVTEHVFFESASHYVARALQELNQVGVRIALDDFGTGYSSLSHLRDFPVDVVKIDRSFVEKMTTDAEVRAIVSAVVDLTQSLHIDVVAEGVETEAQKTALIQEGCKLGQGFYFGRAIEADEVPVLLGSPHSHKRWVA